MDQAGIRAECLQPAEKWERPYGVEVREVLRLAGFSASTAAKALGLGSEGGRTVRRWKSDESAIPYAAWALLCNFAGLGDIWKNNSTPGQKFSG